MMAPTRAIPPITPPTMAPTGVEDSGVAVAEGVVDTAVTVATTVTITDVEEDRLDELDVEDVPIGIAIPVFVSVRVGGSEALAEPRAI